MREYDLCSVYLCSVYLCSVFAHCAIKTSAAVTCGEMYKRGFYLERERGSPLPNCRSPEGVSSEKLGCQPSQPFASSRKSACRWGSCLVLMMCPSVKWVFWLLVSIYGVSTEEVNQHWHALTGSHQLLYKRVFPYKYGCRAHPALAIVKVFWWLHGGLGTCLIRERKYW